MRLAQYYGITAPSADYASVTRPPGRGIGLFAQGAFLATRASSDASSPTQRGIFLLTRLLCRDGARTARHGSAAGDGQHRADHDAPALRAGARSRRLCRYHQIFDPVGFGFEHFDEAGRYREQEVGFPVDSASHVPAKDNSVLFEFASQEELMTKLAEQPELYQCLVGRLATYAFGLAQPCLGAGQVKNLQQGKAGIAEAFAGLAAEPHFTRRKSN